MKCNNCGSENIAGAHFCATCGATLSASDTPSGLVGQVVGGRFHVKRVLGEGGMGVVYEAEQRLGNTTRKVALKTLHPHLSHDPSIAARFNRECGTIAGLEHPNTIRVYDFGATDDGTLYIAMEFVAGKPLQQILETGGALPADRVLKIVRQITGALEEAHQQGIIHRDLKPDNVVLTDRGSEKDVVKLLDFGIAARTDSVDAQREQKLTQQGMVLGTPPYMSPEQFTGKALDLRSDVYSLGVMAYEMVTGGLPFDAQTPWQWATEHMTSQPKPFEASPVAASIPPAMRAAILRALAKNRDERQGSVREFYEELAGERQAALPYQSTGTAMMQAPPQFGGGSPKTAAMPSGGGVGTGPAVAAPMIAPPRSGGGKGLIFGLAGVGGALLIGIIVVATRSSGGGDQPPPQATQPAATTVAPAKIAPVDPVDTATPPTPDPPPVQTTPPAGTPAKPPATTKPTPPTPSAQKPPEQPQQPPPPMNPQPPPPPPPPKGDPCQACISAASSGNISSAASAYGRCTDAGQKSSCASIVKSKAPAAAKAAAFNGNCGQAKAIASAGKAMGAPPRAFADVDKNCP